MTSELIGKIWNEDCLETMKRMEDKSVDLIVTDPPYGIDFIPQRGTFGAIANDEKEVAMALWSMFVPELHRILADDSFAFVFCGWSEVDWVVPRLRSEFQVKACIVWVKNNFGIGYYTRPQHEFAFLCMKGKPKPPEKVHSDVWKFSKEYSLLHSCQKPLELIERAVDTYGAQGGTVFDPFMGSGTTAVACEKLGRRWIGSEINPDYCKIAEKRIEAVRAQGNLFP